MQLNLGCSTLHFLSEFWQKKPLLVRQALPGFQSSVTPAELAGLACEKGVEARIIQGQGKRFSVSHGPFAEKMFRQLPASNWTLLVQSVDQWDFEVAALLQHFAFLPRWRIEDIMISYASKGGSVGAHVDQYDVFLLQAAGKRRWAIDSGEGSSGPRKYALRSEVKLLQRFKATESFDLAPGDMLYLPPGVGHHGVALDSDCMTFSIGLRAPSLTEMLMDFAAERAEMLPDSQRYSDPDLAPRTDANAIETTDIERARGLMQQALALDSDEFANWFGRFITRYRSLSVAARRGNKAISLDARLNSLGANPWVLQPDPRFRWAYTKHGLYAGGAHFVLSERVSAKLLASGIARLDWQTLAQAECAEFEKLYALGALVLA